MEFLQEPTDDGKELIGAAVGEEAAHGVLEGEGQGEGRHTLLAVLIGLRRRGGDKLKKHPSVGCSDTYRADKNSGGVVEVVVGVSMLAWLLANAFASS